MKIESLYISSFGKFKDYRLCFSDSLNVFYGENEAGKTTLMTFIKMMFYGSSAKGNDLSKKPRKKYLPWDNSPMAGSIDFSFEGKSYRIERTFGDSNSSDKVTLIDLDTGDRQSHNGSTELGAKFFGLSLAAFERCVFIGQLNLGESANDESGELNSKLSSLALSGDEDTSEKQISARLLTAKEELMSRGGKKGKYDIAKQRLATLNEELIASRNLEEERESLATKIENQKSRLALVLKEIDRTNASLKATEAKRNFKKLKDYIETLDQLSSFERKLVKADGSIISVADLSKTEDAVANYKLLKERVPELEKEISLIEAELENEKAKSEDKNDPITLVKDKISEINQKLANAKTNFANATETVKELQKEEQESLTAKPKMRIEFIVLCLLGLIGAIPTVILKQYIIAAICGFVFVLFGVLSLVLKKKPQGLATQKEEALNKAKELIISSQNDISSLSEELNAQNELFAALMADSDSATAIREEKIAHKNSLSEKLNELKASISELEELFALMFPKENMTASVSGMEIVLHAYKDYSRKVEAAKTKLA
ncbi:MAG: AAA family ATPase, partial [Oscillospiraceae bacterium]|nr:AAA family ATPase [Oscillospiraceae bacterium]